MGMVSIGRLSLHHMKWRIKKWPTTNLSYWYLCHTVPYIMHLGIVWYFLMRLTIHILILECIFDGFREFIASLLPSAFISYWFAARIPHKTFRSMSLGAICISVSLIRLANSCGQCVYTEGIHIQTDGKSTYCWYSSIWMIFKISAYDNIYCNMYNISVVLGCRKCNVSAFRTLCKIIE